VDRSVEKPARPRFIKHGVIVNDHENDTAEQYGGVAASA
jgi:hypothetical protein